MERKTEKGLFAVLDAKLKAEQLRFKVRPHSYKCTCCRTGTELKTGQAAQQRAACHVQDQASFLCEQICFGS